MKKILLAMKGNNFPETAFAFAKKINGLSPILLTGAFLREGEAVDAWSYTGGPAGPLLPIIDIDEGRMIEESIATFKERCSKANIKFGVHSALTDFALSDLSRESAYADLVLIETKPVKRSGYDQEDYLYNALKFFSCPIVVIPAESYFPDNIVLSYDGSENSIYAIKQFIYLFPELSQLETMLVYADEDEKEAIPARSLIGELVRPHFNKLTIHKLTMDTGKYFGIWVSEKNNALLVSGSSGRTTISQVFKKSFVKDILKDRDVPVFIAHR